MAAPKGLKTVAGSKPATPATGASENPAQPLNDATILAAVVQLQNSVNELAKRVNDHVSNATHTQSGTVAGGAGVAAQNLFTTN